MSFLAPLFLVGALAIAGPILFHLIRRTVRDRVRFSTLMFLKPSPPRLTKRSHLENILLLILRCAVICLLALGFARPYFQSAEPQPPKAASGKRIVVLLDTSASMRRQGLWQAAQRAAVTTIERADANDSIAVAAFDASPHTLFSFEQWQSTPASDRIGASVARVNSAAPSWNSTHIGKALLAAAELILDASHADAEGARPSQIILISDLQQGARLDGLQGYEWPRGIDVRLQTIGSAQLANAGIQILPNAAGESLSVTNIILRARVVNSSGAKSEQFKIGWAVPDSATFIGTPIELHVPGQNRSIGLPAPPTNTANLSLLLTGDAEAFDNRAFHATAPRQSILVAYIGRDSADDPNGQLFYIRRAFPETAAFAVRVDARTPGTNAPIDANFVIATTLDPQDAAPLKAHLQAGKAALLVAPEGFDPSTLAQITDGAAPASTEATGPYVMFGQIDFDHPLFNQFRDARFNDFTRIHFWKHRRLDFTVLPNARTIASFDDKSPALVQIPVGRGALYILASGWSPADSQFALSSKFVPFLFSLLEQSSPVASEIRQLVVGDSIPFPAEFKGASIAVTKPDGSTAEWKKGEAFGATDQPGFYSAREANLLFAVNLDPTESRTAPVAEEQFASIGVPLKADEIQVAPELRKQHEHLLLATEQENRQKLWRRLLIAALALLLIETVAAGIASRRQPVPA